MQTVGNFILERLKAVKYAATGFWILITTENSIITQVIIAIIMTILGFLMHISVTEWLIQTLAIGLVLVAESLNTAIEKIADFVHPGRVDNYDLFVLTNDWLAEDSRCCDISPAPTPDGIVNILDFAEFSRHWLEGQ